MRTMLFIRIASSTLAGMGFAATIYMVGQIQAGQRAIEQNTALLNACNAGKYWCSGESMNDLMMRNGYIDTFSTFIWFFMIVSAIIALVCGGFTAWSFAFADNTASSSDAHETDGSS